MFVWLHTSSPPQHIATIPGIGQAAHGVTLRGYLEATNARRGISARCARLTHNERTGEDALHIFDTFERSLAWATRNASEVETCDYVDLKEEA